jgi:hypothetical protein
VPDKKPRVKKTVKPKKRATIGAVDPQAASERFVAWRLGQVDLGGEWGWRNLASDHLATLHSHLVAFEAETFSDLKRNRRAKSVPVDHLCREAQDRLIELERDDTEQLWELRIPTTDSWRAWGLVDGAVFYFIWWDPDHTVCRGLAKGIARQR